MIEIVCLNWLPFRNVTGDDDDYIQQYDGDDDDFELVYNLKPSTPRKFAYF